MHFFVWSPFVPFLQTKSAHILQADEGLETQEPKRENVGVRCPEWMDQYDKNSWSPQLPLHLLTQCLTTPAQEEKQGWHLWWAAYQDREIHTEMSPTKVSLCGHCRPSQVTNHCLYQIDDLPKILACVLESFTTLARASRSPGHQTWSSRALGLSARPKVGQE